MNFHDIIIPLHSKPGLTMDIINGKAVAEELCEQLTHHVKLLREQHGITPNLSVIIAGDDPASKIYVNLKSKKAAQIGIKSDTHELPSNTTEAKLCNLIKRLNADHAVHGILMQLPLPNHLNTYNIINTILPDKDVDGLSVINAGLLFAGHETKATVPCTPAGCMILLEKYFGSLAKIAGKHAVVIGRSNIVGKPMAALLLQHNCTVTIVHSKTPDAASLCKQADIIIAAAGKSGLVTSKYIKPGAVVIDVGINRESNSKKITGDVNLEDIHNKAAAATPVPGGVGPMTIACLMLNTVKSAYRATGLAFTENNF